MGEQNKPKIGDIFKSQKKWWLTPILIVLAILIAFLIFGKDMKVSSFVYERF